MSDMKILPNKVVAHFDGNDIMCTAHTICENGVEVLTFTMEGWDENNESLASSLKMPTEHLEKFEGFIGKLVKLMED